MSKATRSVINIVRQHSFGIVLILASALRVGHVLALLPLPLFDHLMIDSELYDTWAQRIAAGEWLGGDGAFFSDEGSRRY